MSAPRLCWECGVLMGPGGETPDRDHRCLNCDEARRGPAHALPSVQTKQGVAGATMAWLGSLTVYRTSPGWPQ